MDRHKWVERDVESRGKVAQKTINKILNKESAATIETLDKVGSAFNLKGWQLLLPNLPELYASQVGIKNEEIVLGDKAKSKT